MDTYARFIDQPAVKLYLIMETCWSCIRFLSLFYFWRVIGAGAPAQFWAGQRVPVRLKFPVPSDLVLFLLPRLIHHVEKKEKSPAHPASLTQPTMAAPAADFEAPLARRPRSTGPRRIQQTSSLHPATTTQGQGRLVARRMPLPLQQLAASVVARSSQHHHAPPAAARWHHALERTGLKLFPTLSG